MDASWMDAGWTVYLDRVMLALAGLLVLIAMLGLVLAVFAPQRLRYWPFRFGTGRAARSRGEAVFEFSSYLAYAIGMTSSLWGVRSGVMTLLSLLGLIGVLVLFLGRRSRKPAAGR